jgi:hypothetical protein
MYQIAFFRHFKRTLLTMLCFLLVISLGLTIETNGYNLQREADDGWIKAHSVPMDKTTDALAAYAHVTEWIVKWEDNPPEIDKVKVLEIDLERQIMLVQLEAQVDPLEWYLHWHADPQIVYLEPNHVMKISALPIDPEIERQQYLKQIKALEGWEIANEAPETVIAILDTGIDLNHPDLIDNLVEGFNLIDEGALPMDDNGHGTQIAGVIGAVGNNEFGIAGILWRTKLMPVKVVNRNGEGRPFTVSQGIYQAVDKGAHILLLSLGDPIYTQTLEEAVRYAEAQGVLVIAATGNEGARVNYPAAFPTVLAVGAVTADDRPTGYTNRGPEVHVVAPGNVFTTRLGGTFGSHSGTSMAAPQVVGLAALIWKQHPHLKPFEVRNHIKYTSDHVHLNGWDLHTGHGRINVHRALTFQPVADIYEPNEQREQAAVFPIETNVYAQLRDGRDMDWYKITAPYAGTLHMKVTLAQSRTEGVEIRLFRGNNRIPAATHIIQREKEIAFAIQEGVTYVAIAYRDEERRKTPLNYEIEGGFTIYADAQQPNDSKSQATPLHGEGEVLKATFHKDGLNDWYYIDIPQRGELDIYMTVDTIRLDPVLYFERPDRRVMRVDRGNVNNGQEEHLITEVLPGRHFLRIHHYYGHRVNGEYYIRTIYRPYAEDPYEPNNSREEATFLEDERIYRATLSSEDDVDWYQFNIASPTYVQLRVQDFPSFAGTVATLYRYQEEEPLQRGIQRQDQSQSMDSISMAMALEPGTYYLKLSAREPFPFNQYQLTMVQQPLISGYRDILGHWAKEEIIAATELGLVQGTGLNLFRPNEGMSRAAVALVIYRYFSFDHSAEEMPFNDIGATHWAFEAVQQLYQAGLMRGYEDGRFRPNQIITRAEAAILIDRLLFDSQSPYLDAGFTDISKQHWAYPAVMRLTQVGIIKGYNETQFAPSEPLTRAQFVTLMMRLIESR